jgi:molybdopterin converting factor small subunit
LSIGSFGRRDEWYSPGMTTAAITVKLFAGLESRTPERRASYSFAPSDAATVGDVAVRLGLEPGTTGIVLVNGLHARAGQALAAGDEVSLFPPLGGG